MQTKVMSVTDFTEKHDLCDAAWLLRAIRQIKMWFDSNKNRVLSLCKARYRLETIRQQQAEANMEFFQRFKGLMEAYEHFGGSIGDQGLITALSDPTDPDHPGNVPNTDMTKVKEDHQSAINAVIILRQDIVKKEAYERKIKALAREQTLAMMYLQRVDRKRYGDLWADLHNLHSRGDNQYPDNLGQAYSIVSNHV